LNPVENVDRTGQYLRDQYPEGHNPIDKEQVVSIRKLYVSQDLLAQVGALEAGVSSLLNKTGKYLKVILKFNF